MKILLGNDDGYDASGLMCLYHALRELHDVVVVAPEENCSGASSSLSLHKSLCPRKIADDFYALNGTPADCIHLALNGMLDYAADIVVSGINRGENLGDDTVYSGTLGAAIEGRFLDYPALAVSLAGTEHYATAARVTLEIVQRMTTSPIPNCQAINVNVPDIPYQELAGFVSTTCGSRDPAMSLQVSHTGDRQHFRIGPSGAPKVSEGTDFSAISRNCVSLTPISLNMTDHQTVGDLGNWLNDAGGISIAP